MPIDLINTGAPVYNIVSIETINRLSINDLNELPTYRINNKYRSIGITSRRDSYLRPNVSGKLRCKLLYSIRGYTGLSEGGNGLKS